MTKLSKKYCIIITIILLLLSAVIVSAGYTTPSKYKGLSGLVKAGTKPKIKLIQVAMPPKMILNPTKQTILKNKAQDLLSGKKQTSQFLGTKQSFINVWQTKNKNIAKETK